MALRPLSKPYTTSEALSMGDCKTRWTTPRSSRAAKPPQTSRRRERTARAALARRGLCRHRLPSDGGSQVTPVSCTSRLVEGRPLAGSFGQANRAHGRPLARLDKSRPQIPFGSARTCRRTLHMVRMPRREPLRPAGDHDLNATITRAPVERRVVADGHRRTESCDINIRRRYALPYEVVSNRDRPLQR